MIEINLLPGREKRKRGAGGGLKMPTSLPPVDRMTAFIAAAWILGPLILAFMFLGLRSQRADVATALEQAVAVREGAHPIHGLDQVRAQRKGQGVGRVVRHSKG